MIQVYIKAPIWKSQSVGVNKKIIKDDLMVEIVYTKENGERLYPQTFFMRKDIALRYPIQEVHGVKLCIIPIHDFVVLTNDEVDYARYCQMNSIPFRLLNRDEPKPEPKHEEVAEQPKPKETDHAVQARMDWINN